MDTRIKLQDMFSFSKLPIIIIAIIVISYVLFFVIKGVIKRIKIANANKPVVVKPVDISAEKMKYIRELETLRDRFANSEIDIRAAYQGMSVIIRDYIFAVTGKEVHTYTLEEVKEANMPALETLMEEYYTPEFAEHSAGDVMASIDKTKRAIETWN